MTPHELAEFALSLPEAFEDHPFGFTPDVYKVADRVFAILRPDSDRPFVSLKCDPDLALELREIHVAVTPGYHLNKRHWNSVELDCGVPPEVVRQMVRHSYEQVIRKVPREVRRRLEEGIVAMEMAGTLEPLTWENR